MDPFILFFSTIAMFFVVKALIRDDGWVTPIITFIIMMSIETYISSNNVDTIENNVQQNQINISEQIDDFKIKK